MIRILVFLLLSFTLLANDFKFDSSIVEKNGVKYICSGVDRERAIRNMIDECKEIKEQNIFLSERVNDLTKNNFLSDVKNGFLYFSLGFVASSIMFSIKK